MTFSAELKCNAWTMLNMHIKSIHVLPPSHHSVAHSQFKYKQWNGEQVAVKTNERTKILMNKLKQEYKNIKRTITTDTWILSAIL